MGLRRKNKQNQSRKQKRKTNRQNKRQKRNLKTNKKQTRKNKTKKRVKKLRGGAAAEPEAKRQADENVVMPIEQQVDEDDQLKAELSIVGEKVNKLDTILQEKVDGRRDADNVDNNAFNNNNEETDVKKNSRFGSYIHSNGHIHINREKTMKRVEPTFQQKMYDSMEYIYSAKLLLRHFLSEHEAIMKLLPVDQENKTRMDDCLVVNTIKAVVMGSGLISYDPHDDESLGYKDHMVNRFATIVSEKLYEAIYYRFKEGIYVNSLYTFDTIMNEIEITLLDAVEQLILEDNTPGLAPQGRGGKKKIISGNIEITLFILKNILFLYISNSVFGSNIITLLEVPREIKNFYEERKAERGLKTEQIGRALTSIFELTKANAKEFINNPAAHTIGFVMRPFTRKMVAGEEGIIAKVKRYIYLAAQKINPFIYLHDSLKIQMGLWAHTPLLVLLAEKFDMSEEEGIIAKSLKNIKENIDQIIDMLILSPGERVYERLKNRKIAISQSDLDAKCIYLMDGGLQKIIDRLGRLYVEIKDMGRKDPSVDELVRISSDPNPKRVKTGSKQRPRSKSTGNIT